MSDPNQISKRYAQACHYLDIDRYEQALQILQDLLADFPDDGFLMYQTARCLYFMDLNEEAMMLCQQSLGSGFNEVDVNVLAGCIQTDTGNYYEAEQCFLEALRLNPNYAQALSKYSLLMQGTYFFDKADWLMKEALQTDPNDSVVLHDASLFHIREGNKTQQVEMLQQYLDMGDSELAKCFLWGIHHYLAGNYLEARENYLQAFILDPANKDALEMLEEVDRLIHPLFLPTRIIESIGGLFPMFMLSFIAYFLGALHVYEPLTNWFIGGALCLSGVIFAYVIHTYLLAPLIYKLVVLAREKLKARKGLAL